MPDALSFAIQAYSPAVKCIVNRNAGTQPSCLMHGKPQYSNTAVLSDVWQTPPWEKPLYRLFEPALDNLTSCPPNLIPFPELGSKNNCSGALKSRIGALYKEGFFYRNPSNKPRAWSSFACGMAFLPLFAIGKNPAECSSFRYTPSQVGSYPFFV